MVATPLGGGSVMLGHQYRERARLQRQKDVVDVSRVAQVVARVQFDLLVHRSDHGPSGGQHDVLDHAGCVRAGLPGCEEPERLDEALDVDLGSCPLTNTLPIRRLGLRQADAGTHVTITAAWVLVPSLVVLPAQQAYTVQDARQVRYASGEFAADLTLDEDGYVLHYPGLATRV